MKKRLLLFSTSIVLLSGLIMSYAGGPATNGQNRTGVNNGLNNCSSGGCHSGGSFTNTNLTVSLTKGVNPVTTWQPDSVYTVRISGKTTAPKYGYQLTSAWNNGTNDIPAGTFTAIAGANQVVPSGGFSIFEHTQAATATGGDILASATWTAPSAGTVDTVDFYLTVNNVNGNGVIQGDNSNNVKISFGKQTVSVAQLHADIKVAAYPNPVTDKLNISLENAGDGTYSIRVFDMTGKIVANQSANVKGSYSTFINAAAWAKGMYHVQLQKDGAQRTIAVVKQ